MMVTKEHYKLPDFIIGGSPKSGTTSLHAYLAKHPDICFSSVKEPLYFNADRYLDEDISPYATYFDTCAADKKIGEASSWYLRAAERSAPRIKKWLPEVKLIFILRNPVERAFSDYWYNIQLGYLPLTLSLSKIIEENGPDHFLLRTGLYYDQLKIFLQYFPQEQIKVLISENFRRNPEQELKTLYQFLEVEIPRVLPVVEDQNTTLYPKNLKRYQSFQRQFRSLDRKMVKHPILRSLRRRLFFTQNRNAKPPFPEAEKARLYEVFKIQNEALAQLLQEDLSIWELS